MSKITLTPEDKASLIEAMNNGTEPSPDLLPKLFPGTADKFDVQALDRAKIPSLEYAGKRSKAAILAEAGSGIGTAPLQLVRCFGEGKIDEWRNMIVQGDNLQFLKTCYNNTDALIKSKVKDKVKLIYIDPPFATKSEFGGREGERSYSDKVAMSEFIEGLRERMIYLRELLSDDGSLFVHLDYRSNYLIKVVLDEIFGKDCYKNEIIWCYSIGGKSTRKFGEKHDTIYWYSKTNNYIFNPDGAKISRKPNSHMKASIDETGRERQIKIDRKTGKEYVYYLDEGKIAEDYWTDIETLNREDSQRTNYPTQKPEELLERIIRTASNPGDIVLDCFSGSGTTAAVAEKLNRRWIACDFGKHAIYTIQKRLLRISESKALVEEKDNTGKVIALKGDLYAKVSKPFCVVSSGAYDFSHVMNLRKHKNVYIDFVLGLFQLTRDDEKASKFNLANIFAIKENNPVEVYPVWEDEFLRDVKIDVNYLQEIVDQSSGRLKGEYFIITPESCANVGDTTVKNQNGRDVLFRILSFPYKILEDISRNLQLQEQPSSQANVNNLITSTAFYFNDDVDIEVVRTGDGFQITKFETKILDKEGNRFPGISGLAMLLVDLNFEEDKPFDMDITVFAADIDQTGSMKISDLTESVGLIAIDKHGNESKPFKVK